MRQHVKRPITAFVIAAGALPSWGCTSLTEPSSERTLGEVAATRPAQQPTTAAVKPRPTPPAPPAPAAQEPQVTASHVLVAFEGATRSRATRSKEEAKQRATELLARIKKGEDFGKVAREESDDPTAKRNDGSLGSFSRSRMVKPFADAAFELDPGQTSDLVETPFGYHIIRREK